MTLDEMNQQLQSDLKIDFVKLGHAAAENPVLYAKWLERWAEAKKLTVRASLKLSKVKKERLDWINGRSEDEICDFAYDKSEIKTVIEGHPEYQRAQGELETAGIRLEFCKHALDAIKNRGFSIKHAIDMRMLEEGK